MTHVELDRKFWEITSEEDADPDALRFLSFFRKDSQPGWEQLLTMSRVVVLAEARTGKTEEFRETALKLRSTGKAAFFCAIEELATVGLEEAFDIGTYKDFSIWCKDDQPGWIFLDSVDEARLINYDYFKRALKRLKTGLGDAAERAFIYISCRGGRDWNEISDLGLVEEWLPGPLPQQTQQETTTETSRTGLRNEGAPVESNIRIFRLAPLSNEQITLFAGHHNVKDPDHFLTAIERADAGIFAERPGDLLDLIAYWRQFDRIASLEEMTEYNVSRQLCEINPKHGQKDPLSQEKARAGIEIIAAALTFSQRNYIALPDSTQSAKQADSLLDVQMILPDWTLPELNSLLRKPLFDEPVYGRIRIHHRSVREYLTAQWLYRLLAQGKSRRSVEQLIFAERYGLSVVAPSIKTVAAWLALWDEQICARLCDISPEILIGFGDPSRLSIPVREHLLRQFAKACAADQYYDESIDLPALRHLADERLVGVFIELLQEYRSHREVRKLLLRAVWQGELRDCAEMALSFALDQTMDRYTRLVGIRVIDSCGSQDQQQQISNAIIKREQSADVHLISAVCEAFFPQCISVADLLEVLRKCQQPKPYSTSPMAEALEQIVEKCSEGQLLALVCGLVDLLEVPPYVDERYCLISKRYAWIVPHAKNIAQRLLKQSPPYTSEPVLRAVELAALWRHHGQYSYHGPEVNLSTIVNNNKILRHLFFWRSVAQIRSERQLNNERLDDWWHVRFCSVPWVLAAEDFDYFLTQAKEQKDPDNRLVAYSVALSLWHDSGRSAQRRQQLSFLAQQNQEMAAKLDKYLSLPISSPEDEERNNRAMARKSALEEKEQQEREKRKQWILELKASPQRLREISTSTVDEKFADLYWLIEEIYNHKESGDSKWGVDHWEVLIEEFGVEVAEATRDGLMAYWRLYEPTEELTGGLRVGMVGLAIEAKSQKGWANELSFAEALLAVRYAVREMNGLPHWLENLLLPHPQAVDEILQKNLLWEFDLTDGDPSLPVHQLLSQLRYTQLSALKIHFTPFVLQCLQNREPRRDSTLEDALSIILQWEGLQIDVFADLAKTRYAAAHREARRLTWLVAWLCVEADGALAALQQWLARTRGDRNKQEHMIRFCCAMGDHHFTRFGSIHRDFERIACLEKFVPLVYHYIRREDDSVHEGSYTPDARDHAEGIRSYLLGVVCDLSGCQSFAALMNFSKTLPHPESCKRMKVLARRRAAADAKLPAWLPEDVLAFAKTGVKPPTTDQDLFVLVCNRLDDLKDNLEDGDNSSAVILQRVDRETELRNWFAGELRKSANGFYSVAPEEELADATRPDIRIHVREIDAPCVIELKISDNWSYREHAERLRNQLVGQYLRDVRSCYGIFLLVRRHKSWWMAGKRLSFQELVGALQQEADQIIQQRPDLQEIKVIGIDLTKR